MTKILFYIFATILGILGTSPPRKNSIKLFGQTLQYHDEPNIHRPTVTTDAMGLNTDEQLANMFQKRAFDHSPSSPFSKLNIIGKDEGSSSSRAEESTGKIVNFEQQDHGDHGNKMEKVVQHDFTDLVEQVHGDQGFNIEMVLQHEQHGGDGNKIGNAGQADLGDRGIGMEMVGQHNPVENKNEMIVQQDLVELGTKSDNKPQKGLPVKKRRAFLNRNKPLLISLKSPKKQKSSELGLKFNADLEEGEFMPNFEFFDELNVSNEEENSELIGTSSSLLNFDDDEQNLNIEINMPTWANSEQKTPEYPDQKAIDSFDHEIIIPGITSCHHITDKPILPQSEQQDKQITESRILNDQILMMPESLYSDQEVLIPGITTISYRKDSDKSGLEPHDERTESINSENKSNRTKSGAGQNQALADRDIHGSSRRLYNLNSPSKLRNYSDNATTRRRHFDSPTRDSRNLERARSSRNPDTSTRRLRNYSENASPRIRNMDISRTRSHNTESSTMRRHNLEEVMDLRNSASIATSSHNSISPTRLRNSVLQHGTTETQTNEQLVKRIIYKSIQMLGLEPRDYGFSSGGTTIWIEILHRNMEHFVADLSRATRDLGSAESFIGKMRKNLSVEARSEIENIFAEIETVLTPFTKLIFKDIYDQEVLQQSRKIIETSKELSLLFVYMRLYRKLHSLLLMDVVEPNKATCAISKWLSKLVQKICFEIIGKARKSIFKKAAKWLANLENLEDNLELADLAILISLPQTEMLRNAIDRADGRRPSMVAHLFDWVDQDQFLAQFERAWTNPWAGPEKNQLGHICKLAGRRIVNSQIAYWLGTLYTRNICEMRPAEQCAEQATSSLHPNSVRQLQLRVYEELHHRLQEDATTEYDEIVATMPKLGKQRANVLKYLEKCVKLIKYEQRKFDKMKGEDHGKKLVQDEPKF